MAAQYCGMGVYNRSILSFNPRKRRAKITMIIYLGNVMTLVPGVSKIVHKNR